MCVNLLRHSFGQRALSFSDRYINNDDIIPAIGNASTNRQLK